MPKNIKAGNADKYPNNIGRRCCLKMPNGTKRYMTIDDEISCLQQNLHTKLIVMQRMRDEKTNELEYRFGYYMIGVKPSRKDKWVWGQYCLLLPKQDLKAVLKKAKRKGWL